MIKKAVKGTFGYLDAQKKRVFLRTVIYFAIPLSLLAAGIISTGSRRNLLTVVAILGCLPACKSLVNLILYCRTRGCSEAAHETIVLVSRERGLKGMYDLYFTSYKRNFAISHMVVCGKNLCGFTEDPGCDAKACKEHLDTMLKQGGCKDMTVKIFTDLPKYCERLRQLSESAGEKDSELGNRVRIVLYDISL